MRGQEQYFVDMVYAKCLRERKLPYLLTYMVNIVAIVPSFRNLGIFSLGFASMHITMAHPFSSQHLLI